MNREPIDDRAVNAFTARQIARHSRVFSGRQFLIWPRTLIIIFIIVLREIFLDFDVA